MSSTDFTSCGEHATPLIRTRIFVCILFIALPLLYSAGQEKIAFHYPHDDYYFLLRADDYDLHGNHLAYTREYLYSFFIYVTRVLGTGLRNAEVIGFGVALFYLWGQVLHLSRSRWMAWGSVFPLLLFTYQHPVFNRTTYDALQLILTPLSLGTALAIFNSKASRCSLIAAGVIAGLQCLTRPEGALYLLPPLVALGLTAGAGVCEGKRKWVSACVFCLIPLTMVQAVSAWHYSQYGFWATTIMKSSQFQSSLKALMSIDPQNRHPDPYGSLPISSMEKAYAASPAFRKAKAFFADHLEGAGWSGFAHYNYKAIDGSISGGHTQWAWFEAGASIAGSRPDQILTYHAQVAKELEAAFDSGELPRRHVWTPAFGAEFSPIGRPFLSSLVRLWKPHFHWDEPQLPQRASRASAHRVERDYDWIALRRRGLVDDQHWQKTGWLLNPQMGIPREILLDEEAVRSGMILSLIDRPDVGQVMLGLPQDADRKVLVGFMLQVQGNASGGILVRYANGEEVQIPVLRLRHVETNSTYKQDGVHVRIDDDYGNTGFAAATDRKVMGLVSTTSQGLHWVMRILLPCSLVGVLLVWFCPQRLGLHAQSRRWFMVAVLPALVLLVSRWVVLAAIDAGITPGNEPRYLASGMLAFWFIGTFSLAFALEKVWECWRDDLRIVRYCLPSSRAFSLL